MMKRFLFVLFVVAVVIYASFVRVVELSGEQVKPVSHPETFEF